MFSGQVICVLGMHRSGTSLITKSLNLLGVNLGPDEHLMIARGDNPKGFWESRLISAVNDEILFKYGGNWHEPPDFPSEWENSPEMADLSDHARKLLKEDFATSDLWGWKDPRTCLTLPFWQKLLPSMKYVICLRNPVDVALSLNRRDSFAFEKSSNLWLTYTEAALEHTSGQKRHIVFYEDFMENQDQELKRMSTFIGKSELAENINIKNAVQGFKQGELHHYRSSTLNTINEPQITFPVKSLYSVLRINQTLKLGKSPDDMDYAEVVDAFGKSSLEAQNEANIRNSRTDEIERSIKNKDEQIIKLEVLGREKDFQLANMERLVRVKNQYIINLEKSISIKNDHIKHLANIENRMIDLEKTISDKDIYIANLERAEATLRHIYGSHGWKLLAYLYRFRDRSLPPDSKRRSMVKMLFGAARTFKKKLFKELN